MLFFSMIALTFLIFHANAEEKHEKWFDGDRIEASYTNLLDEEGYQIEIPWTSAQYNMAAAEDEPSMMYATANEHPYTWDGEIISHNKRDQDFITAGSNLMNLADVRYDQMVRYVLMCLVILVGAVILVGIVCFASYNLYKRNKGAESVDYPAYGVTGPNAIADDLEKNQLGQPAIYLTSGEHYVQQNISDTDEEPDSVVVQPTSAAAVTPAGAPHLPLNNAYTVFECAGLAAQMSNQVIVKNPLFPDDGGDSHIPEKE